MLQVFESHADLLSPDLFNKFCLPVLNRIQVEVTSRTVTCGLEPVPMVSCLVLTSSKVISFHSKIHAFKKLFIQVIFAKGGHYALKELSQLNYSVIGLDWTIDPKVGRQQVKPDTVLQGNLDPCALFGSPVIPISTCFITLSIDIKYLSLKLCFRNPSNQTSRK